MVKIVSVSLGGEMALRIQCPRTDTSDTRDQLIPQFSCQHGTLSLLWVLLRPVRIPKYVDELVLGS